jgi:hypothetical protein
VISGAVITATSILICVGLIAYNRSRQLIERERPGEVSGPDQST